MEQTLTFEIHAADGTVRARDTGEQAVHLAYADEYRKGDTIRSNFEFYKKGQIRKKPLLNIINTVE